MQPAMMGVVQLANKKMGGTEITQELILIQRALPFEVTTTVSLLKYVMMGTTPMEKAASQTAQESSLAGYVQEEDLHNLIPVMKIVEMD